MVCASSIQQRPNPSKDFMLAAVPERPVPGEFKPRKMISDSLVR